MSSRQALARAIESSFPTEPIPSADQLVASPERAASYAPLVGKSWRDVVAINDKAIRDLINPWFMPPEAWCYYLPALLLQALEDDGEVGGVVLRLRPRSWNIVERDFAQFDTTYRPLSANAREAIRDFLVWLTEEELGFSVTHWALEALQWGWSDRTAIDPRFGAHRDVLHHYQRPTLADPVAEALAVLIEQAFRDTPVPKRPISGSDEGGDHELAMGGYDWRVIHPRLLQFEYSFLSFGHNDAFRYFLPAFMCADLADAFDERTMRFHLVTYGHSRAADFTDQEKQAIGEYLRYRNYDQDLNVLEAINTIWAHPLPPPEWAAAQHRDIDDLKQSLGNLLRNSAPPPSARQLFERPPDTEWQTHLAQGLTNLGADLPDAAFWEEHRFHLFAFTPQALAFYLPRIVFAALGSSDPFTYSVMLGFASAWDFQRADRDSPFGLLSEIEISLLRQYLSSVCRGCFSLENKLKAAVTLTMGFFAKPDGAPEAEALIGKASVLLTYNRPTLPTAGAEAVAQTIEAAFAGPDELLPAGANPQEVVIRQAPWQRIHPLLLEGWSRPFDHRSLAFRRAYLPAHLIAALQNKAVLPAISELADADGVEAADFSSAQRQAIRAFLRWFSCGGSWPTLHDRARNALARWAT